MPCFRPAWAVSILAALLLLPSLLKAEGSRYFVSPEGSDQWSGRRADRAMVGDGGPFRTLARARRAVREELFGGTVETTITVELAQGVYGFPAGLVLRPSELGSEGVRVVYRAAPGQRVVFRGDRTLPSWQTEQDSRFRSPLPEGEGWAVFRDGSALPRARYPDYDSAHPRSGGFCYVASMDRVADTLFLRLVGMEDLAPASWGKLSESTVHIWPDGGSRVRARVIMAGAERRVVAIGARAGINPGTRLFFEGVPDEMDAVGEWLADPEAKILRLQAEAGWDVASEVTVATTACLLRIEGPGNIGFEGIDFRGSAGDLVRIQGASAEFVRCSFELCDGDALVATQATGLRVEGCDFRHVGGSALRLAASPSAEIRNCWIAETGTSQGREGAVVLEDAASPSLVIAHNLLHDLPGSGIVLRGVGHRCEANWLHDLGLEECGGAGIVVLDGEEEHPTLIRGNVVGDPGGYRRTSASEYSFPADMAGIAVVDGAGTVVEENMILRAPTAAIHVAGRRHHIRNNLLAGTGASHIDVGSATELTVLRNVALGGGEATAWLQGDRLPERLLACDWNVLWAGSNDLFVRLGDRLLDWDEWQALRMDPHSALADPLCRAPSLDEYGLLPESLALKLGFVPLAPEKTGCVEAPERRTWPIDSDLWRENHRLGVPRATVRTKDLPPQP